MERKDFVLSIPQLRALCLGLLAISIGAALWGAINGSLMCRFITSARRVPGMVDGTYTKHSNIDPDVYTTYTIISFQNEDGKRFVIHTSQASYLRRFHLGQQVSVYYDPADPNRARLDTFRSLWGRTALLFVNSALSGLAGAFLMWYFSNPRHLTFKRGIAELLHEDRP